MTVTAIPKASGVAPPAEPEQRGRPWLLAAVSAAEGAALAVVVTYSGMWVWRPVRGLAAVGITAVAVLALRDARRLTRGLVALGLGIVGTAVGAGIAVPWLSKSGVTAMGTAGAVALVGGLVLLVAGAAVLVRLARGWWRLAALPVGLVVLAFVIWPLSFAVAATNVPPTTLGRSTPATFGLPFTEARFAATGGVALSGWYIPSPYGAAVLSLHGSGSTRSEVLNHAVVLARHGFGVLLYDARGHGRSGGRAMDFGWYGDEDIAGALRFLQRQPGVDSTRIAAVGMSMGGEEAIGAAATMPAIRAVVAEGATNRQAGDKAWLSEAFGFQGTITEGVEHMTFGLADLLTNASPPITLHDAVRKAAPRPVLLIAAGSVADEARAGRYIQSASLSTVDLWVVPNTTHTHALGTHRQEWEERVVGFLDHALRVNESGGTPQSEGGPLP